MPAPLTVQQIALYPQWFLLLVAVLGILIGSRSSRDLEVFAKRLRQVFNQALEPASSQGIGIRAAKVASSSGWKRAMLEASNDSCGKAQPAPHDQGGGAGRGARAQARTGELYVETARALSHWKR